MSNRLAHSGRPALLSLTVTVLALLACNANAQRAATADATIAATDTVTVTVSGSADQGWKIDVKPKVSFVMLGGKLFFEVKGLPSGHSLEIDYRVENDKKGPFNQRADKTEPRGRLTFTTNTKFQLDYDDKLVDTAVWKYDVSLRNGAKEDVKVIDPMTVGKGNN